MSIFHLLYPYTGDAIHAITLRAQEKKFPFTFLLYLLFILPFRFVYTQIGHKGTTNFSNLQTFGLFYQIKL